MNLQRILQIARAARERFAALDEGNKDNPYGGDSVYKIKLLFQGFNPKLKGTTAKGMNSDKFWEVKVRADGSVMRKWGATGQKAKTKIEKKNSVKTAVAYAKGMAAKKMAKGYKKVDPKSDYAKSKKVYPSFMPKK